MNLVPVHRFDADVAIVGSGFAGSMLALVLRSRGLHVALLDRGSHPRFAIGESSTPLAGLLIEEIADRYELPRLRPFSKWGTWQATYPQVACGLKRGFSFLRHDQGRTFGEDPTHERQLLVAASPHGGIADTHWYRPDFDHWLAREAEAAGVMFLDRVALDVPRNGGRGILLEGAREGKSIHVDATFLVDASGPRGYLWRALEIGDTPLRWLTPTQALYTHFAGVERWDALVTNDTTPPYPVDDAALHHVLPGAWIWMLRFNNGITSAGIAATEPIARKYRLSDGQAAWWRMLADYPSIREQFDAARATCPFVHTPRVAHRAAAVTGPNWALLPSAAGVIDPLLSTGFPLTLLGVMRIAEVLLDTVPGTARETALTRYAAQTAAELDSTERLVAALYATMNDFTVFKRLAAMYFAAASYTETVRRLGEPQRARGFLLCDDLQFGPALRDITARACALSSGPNPADVRKRLLDDIEIAIAPFDVSGLSDTSRRDWFPVCADDLRAARKRLGVTSAAIEALLTRCGFAAPEPAAIVARDGAGAIS